MSDEYAAKMCALLEKMCDKLDKVYGKLEEIQGSGLHTSISDVYEAIKESDSTIEEKLDKIQGDGLYDSISDVSEALEEANKYLGDMEDTLTHIQCDQLDVVIAINRLSM